MPPSRQRHHFERAVLGNGLKVLVVPSPADNLVGVSVVYNVGFRSEPEGRTGFAHLFEHMMFQGSAHVGKVEHIRLVESAGGVMNGHTRADLTAYYEALPPSALELALFLEADRMASLAITEENLRNQVDVVKEEILVNVVNRPYGGFPWIPLPALAFDSYPNAHNGYGDFSHLEQATVEESEDFYSTYYAPPTPCSTVVGACRPEEVVLAGRALFRSHTPAPVPAHGPWPEPRLSERPPPCPVPDHLAPQPAFAIGYRTVDPVGELDRYVVYHVLADVLAGGDASRLQARLVHKDHSVTDVGCMLGTFGDDDFFMRDPSLLQVVVFHPGTSTTEALLGRSTRRSSAWPAMGRQRGAAPAWSPLLRRTMEEPRLDPGPGPHGRFDRNDPRPAELIDELAAPARCGHRRRRGVGGSRPGRPAPSRPRATAGER